MCPSVKTDLSPEHREQMMMRGVLKLSSKEANEGVSPEGNGPGWQPDSVVQRADT